MYETVCIGLALVAPCSSVLEDCTKGSFRLGNVKIVGNLITPQDEIFKKLNLVPGQRLSRLQLWEQECRLRIGFATSPYFQRRKAPRILVLNEDKLFKNIIVLFPEQAPAGDSK